MLKRQFTVDIDRQFYDSQDPRLFETYGGEDWPQIMLPGVCSGRRNRDRPCRRCDELQHRSVDRPTRPCKATLMELFRHSPIASSHSSEVLFANVPKSLSVF